MTKLNNQLAHPQYRADVDGLRAVAVLAVIGYHAFPGLVPGGFIGVDIFFVISGYLISTIIMEGLQRGTFSFAEFYSRRIRRIFPALLVVLVTIYAFGWFTLMGEEYAQLGKHIAGGAGFVSNLVLWGESGYFDAGATSKPLLHLWSLGIEEQFYIAWPLLLWAAWKIRLNWMALTAFIATVSFALSVATIRADAVEAFYSPIMRFWELLVGSGLAYLTLRRPGFVPALALPGFVLVLLPLWLLDDKSLFPGWWALMPTVGAAFVIAAGSQAWPNRLLLSNRAVVWMGLISYPLYLWHWPLLSFADILVGGTPPPQYRALCLLAALFLAWLTYSVVERPLRARRYTLQKSFSLSALMALVGFLGFNVLDRDGLPFRHEQLTSQAPSSTKADGFTSLGVSIEQDHENYSCAELVPRTTRKIDAFCHLTGSEPYLAVIGDSHSNHLFFGLKNSPDRRLNRVLIAGAGGCQPALQAGQSENCDDQSRTNLELVKRLDALKYVALAGNAASIQTLTGAQYHAMLNGYLSTVARLQGAGKTVIFIIDTPNFLASPASCAPNPLPLRNVFKSAGSLCKTRPADSMQPREVYNRFIRDLAKHNASIVFFDAYSIFCNEAHCRVVDNSTLLFKDTNHLTDYGSKLVAENLRHLVH